NEICIIACHYALEKKNQQLVDLVNKYGKYIKWGKFEFKGETNNLLMHLISDVGANNLTCARYLLENECAIARKVVEQTRENGARICDDANETREQVPPIVALLSMKTSATEYTTTMNSLFKVVIAMIDDGKVVSSDLFNMCWLHDKERLWSALFKKCKSLLQIDTLHQDVLAWKWLEEYLLDNRELLVWLDEMEPVEKEKRVGPCHTSKKVDTEKKSSSEKPDIKEEEEELLESKSVEDNTQKNSREDHNSKARSNVNIRWNLIKNFCMQDVELKQLTDLNEKMNRDYNRYKKEYEQLMSWKWSAHNSLEPDGNKKQSVRCRQDNDSKGVKCTLTSSQLFEMQTQSDDVMFYPKHFYDFEIYLSELFTRAHKMNRTFQTEIKSIFDGREGCLFEEGPVKSLERSKLKAQVEYKDAPFPRSAQVVDILRCQITFDTVIHLLNGLGHFNVMMMSPRYKNTFKVVRVKNEFAECLSSQKRDKLDFSKFIDIKMNVLFTKNNESIVTEVQFSLKIIAKLKKKQHPLYEIMRQESFLYDALRAMSYSQFDVQLQMASFHPKEMANLMLFFPDHFGCSPLIHCSKDSKGSNFISQMANNSQVVYSYANPLLRARRFIPQTTVQSKLVQPNEKNSYPLMFALWKQTSIDTIKLFIPQEVCDAKTVWNAINDVKFEMEKPLFFFFNFFLNHKQKKMV
ncbi:hypothetical protein RFI_19164, partial [Reticulomyxa filosa]